MIRRTDSFLRSAMRRGEQGFALILALLFVVIVAMLAVSMLRGLGLQGKVAGNTLEKQRSLEAAQTALQYGEWWVNLGAAGTGVACVAPLYNANTLSAMKTCTTVLTPTTAIALPWTIGGTYTPPTMTVQSGGGVAASGVAGDVNYAAAPQLYIAYAGLAVDGKSALYQVTAAGYGGSSFTASVVQSLYAMGTKVTDIGGP